MAHAEASCAAHAQLCDAREEAAAERERQSAELGRCTELIGQLEHEIRQARLAVD